MPAFLSPGKGVSCSIYLKFCAFLFTLCNVLMITRSLEGEIEMLVFATELQYNALEAKRVQPSFSHFQTIFTYFVIDSLLVSLKEWFVVFERWKDHGQ